MTNHMWRVGFDPDSEQFYCENVDGSPVVPRMHIQGIDGTKERIEMIAAAVKVANERKLQIMAMTPWQDDLWIVLVGEFAL